MKLNKDRIERKILRHAEQFGTITIASTMKAAKLARQTAERYLTNMTLAKKLVMEEQKKDGQEDSETGYTYRFWRLKQS